MVMKYRIFSNVDCLAAALSVVIQDILIGAEGRGFDSWAGHGGRSVANGSLLLRNFEALLPWRYPAQMTPLILAHFDVIPRV